MDEEREEVTKILIGAFNLSRLFIKDCHRLKKSKEHTASTNVMAILSSNVNQVIYKIIDSESDINPYDKLKSYVEKIETETQYIVDPSSYHYIQWDYLISEVSMLSIHSFL